MVGNMTLQASIRLPGMIKVNYPYQNQVISSHVKLAGLVNVPSPKSLPQGIQYLLDQLSPSQQSEVLQSHQLYNKKYYLYRLTYYVDNQAVREVDYTADEISSYQFTEDYLNTIYNNTTIELGDHVFAIMATFFSPQNPGVMLYDFAEIKFKYQNDSTSLLPYMESLAPQQFVGQLDHKIFLSMLDYALTQRTEGAVKNDIDYLESLYDIDTIPQSFIPYLAKTVGYDYFAGLLGNDNTLREEIRFLPDWQKSAGTQESILVLLRALNLHGVIHPLYLDLLSNTLVSGVNQQYEGTTEIKIPSQTKKARFSFVLNHSTFIPNTTKFEIQDQQGNILASFIWDIQQNQPFWMTFESGWLEKESGPAGFSDLSSVYVDNQRGGITVVFSEAVKTTIPTIAVVTYQYALESRPGANTRLSEFFDMTISSLSKPNEFPAKDMQHVTDIIERSKPFRTKLRTIDLPISSADAYFMTPTTGSSTGNLNSLDRLDANNIKSTEVNLRNPISESVSIVTKNQISDGFLFSWEDPNSFYNRFDMIYSLAIDPELHDEQTRQMFVTDPLIPRGHALLVHDDTNQDATWRRRNLRQLGFVLENDRPSIILSNQLVHYDTLTDTVSQTKTYQDLVIEIDSTSTTIQLNLEIFNDKTNRNGYSLIWGPSSLQIKNLNTGTTSVSSWTVNNTNYKKKTLSYTQGNYELEVYRFISQSEIDAFYTARPDLNNYQFELNKWYAVWKLTSNFYTYPTHLSVYFPSVKAQKQLSDEYISLGGLSTAVPVEFDSLLGTAYQFSDLVLEVVNNFSDVVEASWKWNGNRWESVVSSSIISATLTNASGAWTTPISIVGSVQFIGAAPTGSANNWDVRLYANKIGDNFQMDIGMGLEDDFGNWQTHRGVFGVDSDLTYYISEKIPDLFDHQHNQGNQRMAAFDGLYFKGGELFPGFRLIAGTGSSFTQYDHYPKKVVQKSLTSMPSMANAAFEVGA